MSGRTKLLTILAVVLVAGLGIGGYFTGESKAPSVTEAEQARLEAQVESAQTSRRRAFTASHVEGRREGLVRGRATGEREGADAGDRAGEAQAGEELAAIKAEAAASAEAERLAAAATPGYEDDGGAYDPSPPSAGFYGSFEAFCADQPEETECGGSGDPASP